MSCIGNHREEYTITFSNGKFPFLILNQCPKLKSTYHMEKLNEKTFIKVKVHSFHSIKWENFYKSNFFMKILTWNLEVSIIAFDFVGSVLVEETEGQLSTWTARRSASGGSDWLDFWSYLWERRGKREVWFFWTIIFIYLLKCCLSIIMQIDGHCVGLVVTRN